MKKQYRYIGKPFSNADVYGKVTGSLLYCKDRVTEKTLHMKLAHAKFAHGIIEDIDTSKAEKIPGVIKIYTFKNTPDKLYDRGRVTSYEQAPYQERLFDRHIRFYGERVAAVVAKDEETAAKAASLIEVTYQKLPNAITMDEAEREDAPRIHEEGNVYVAPVQEYGNYETCKGEVALSTFSQNGRITHLSMETTGTFVEYEKAYGKLTLYCGCQTVFGIRSTVADFLEMPYTKVRVIKVPMGGSFGCKQETIVEPLAAYAAKDLKSEILLIYTREEQIQNTMLKHNLDEWVESKSTRDGKLLGLSFKLRLDSGAFQTISPSYCRTIGGKLGKVYNIPNLRFEGRAICTTTPVNGSFRSWGSAEATLGVECHMNLLAKKLGLDPIELRMKNVKEPYMIEPMHHTHVGKVHFKECMIEGSKKFDWEGRKKECKRKNEEQERYRYGVGMAICSHTTSFYPYQTDVATAIGRVQEDGTLIMHVGIHDHGCGTVMAMKKIAAEVMEMDLEQVDVHEADTEVTMYDYGCYASRTVYVLGKAVKKCCEELIEKAKRAAAMKFQCSVSTIQYCDGKFYNEVTPERTVNLAKISEYMLSVMGEDLYQVTTVNSVENPGTPAAHFTEVEVDTYTGAVNVVYCVSAHDIGKAINPDLCVGQVGSGIQQGLGMALSEEIKIHPETGETLITNLKNYEMRNSADMPDYDAVFIEDPEENGPFGAKGIGEVVVAPIAPAVVAAVNDALGTEFCSIPITKAKIMEALEGRCER